jgi:hypothetical protein
VACRDATGEERRTNLSYGKSKMVIKHDEEMARNKMEVDVLLWEETEWRFKERGYSIIQNGNESGDEVLYVNVRKGMNLGGEKYRHDNKKFSRKNINKGKI